MDLYKAYYKGNVMNFSLPTEWTVLGVGEPKETPAIPSLDAVLTKKLENPINTPSIQQLATSAQNATIIVDDQTRPTPAHQLLPTILQVLNSANISDGNINLIIGRGTHRAPTDNEIKTKIGNKVYDRIPIEVHDPDNQQALTYLGVSTLGTPIWINKKVAEADLTIAIGNIAPHYFAGYGGGGKIILPGVSGRKTIVKNHTLIKDPNTIQGKIDGNVVYSDMLEIARKAGLDLKIDVILNMENQIADFSVGEVGAEHAQGIARFNEIYGFRPPRKADITITCGYPLESNLIQSSKAVMSADLITKDKGTIILVSACYDGTGHGLYETLREKPEPEEVIEWIAHGKSLPSGGPVASRTRAILKKKQVVVVTDGVASQKIEDIGMIPYTTLSEAIDDLASSHKTADVIILPSGSSVNPLISSS
jgi:nickel-dependent lactate racemase